MPGESVGSRLHKAVAEFQSTPGINAGRIMRVGSRWIIVDKFQSTPGINAGRISRRARHTGAS